MPGPDADDGNPLGRLYRLAVLLCGNTQRACDLVVATLQKTEQHHRPLTPAKGRRYLLDAFVTNRPRWIEEPQPKPAFSQGEPATMPGNALVGPGNADDVPELDSPMAAATTAVPAAKSPVEPDHERAVPPTEPPADLAGLTDLPPRIREAAVLRFYLDLPITSVSNVLRRSGLGVRRDLRLASALLAQSAGLGRPNVAAIRRRVHHAADALPLPPVLMAVAAARAAQPPPAPIQLSRSRLALAAAAGAGVTAVLAVVLALLASGPSTPPAATGNRTAPFTQPAGSAAAGPTVTVTVTAPPRVDVGANTRTTTAAPPQAPTVTTGRAAATTHPLTDPFRTLPACGATIRAHNFPAHGFRLAATTTAAHGQILTVPAVDNSSTAILAANRPRLIVWVLSAGRLVATPKGGTAGLPAFAVLPRRTETLPRYGFLADRCTAGTARAAPITPKPLAAGRYQVLVGVDTGTDWALSAPTTVTLAAG